MSDDKIININPAPPATAPVINQTFNFNGDVHQMNTGSTVTNHYHYGADGKLVDATTDEQDPATMDKAHLREEILQYVGQLYEFYTPDWQMHYKELWNDILEMPVVDLKVYKRGKQRDTHFNRNLVGNIIGFLDRYNLYADGIVPGTFTHALAKDGKGKSVRDAMSEKPDPEICDAIKQLMASKKYFELSTFNSKL